MVYLFLRNGLGLFGLGEFWGEIWGARGLDRFFGARVTELPKHRTRTEQPTQSELSVFAERIFDELTNTEMSA